MKTIRVALFLLLLSAPVFAGINFDLSSFSNYNIRLDGAADSHFLGSAVATGDINGDGKADLVVGADGASNSGLNSGSVYIIFGGDSLSGNIDLNSYSDVRFDGAAAYDQLGSSVACGDINGDGYDDIIMGAYLADVSTTKEGSVYVVFGSGSLSGTKALSDEANFAARFDGPAADANLGYSVGVGDVNDDGRDDLVLGAPQAGSSGEAFLIFGSSSFTKIMTLSAGANYDARFIGAANDDSFGSSIALGNVDAVDGADILIGAYLGDYDTRSACGFVYLIQGSNSYLPNKERSVSDSSNYVAQFIGANSGDQLGANDELGKSLAVGDVDGDGMADLIMGAHLAYSGAGSVYLVAGAASYTSLVDLLSESNYKARFDGASAGDRLGTSVVMGNIDNDSCQDMFFGAAYAGQNARANSGSVYVVCGTSESYSTKVMTLSASANYDLRFDGAAALDKLGYSLASGDVNGNGKDDVVMGAFMADNNGRTNSGSVYVYSTLVQPAISMVSPNSKPQHWIGDIVINGADFEDGCSVSFSDPNILVYRTVFRSSTSIEARINILPATSTATPKDITVTNPGGVVGKSIGIFTVTAGGNGPTFTNSDIVFTYGSDTYIYPTDVDPADGKLPLPAHTGLSISGRIEDTSGSGMSSTAEAVKFSVLSQNAVNILYYNLASSLSNFTANTVDFTFTNFNIIPGTTQIVLYAEDSSQNPAQFGIPFKVVDTSEAIEQVFIGETVDEWVIQTYANQDIEVDFVIVGHNPHPVIIRNVKLYTSRSLSAMGVRGNQTIRGYTSTVVRKTGPLAAAGIYVLMARDVQTGKLLTKNGRPVLQKLVNRVGYR